jgi:SSS family solute:Na+ symporter
MKTADLVVFLVYLVGIIGVGGHFYRKNKTSSAFTLGNHAVPAWAISLSFFATFVSSISYLALPGSSYLGNWNAFTFSLSIPAAALIAVWVFIPLYRKVQSPSAYTYLEQRFGLWARMYASTMYLLTQLMRVGTILYLMALTVHTLFGWDLVLIIMFTGGLVALYSVLGGIQAVVWTDAIQAIVLIVGALICTVYLLWGMPEGPGPAFKLLWEQEKFSLGSFDADLTQATFWVVFIYGLFINLQNYGIDQNYVQRYMVARSQQEARKSAFWGGMLYIPVSLLFLFIGSCLYVFYQSAELGLPSDQVFPYFIVNELPQGITGIIIASIFAAGMSTISTSFNSAATVVLTDFVQRLAKTPISDRSQMTVLYLSTVMVALLGIAIGIAMIEVKSALDAWWKLASIFSGGMLGLFLLGVFSRQKNTLGAVTGTIAGLLVILYLSLNEVFGSPESTGFQFHSYLTIVIGTLTIFLLGFLIGLIGKSRFS